MGTRIALVIMDLGVGGAERVLVNLANFWAAQADKEVTIITIGNSESFYPLHQEIKLVQLNAIQESATIFQAFASNYQRFRAIREAIKFVKPAVIISFMTTTNVLTTFATRFLKTKLIIADRANPVLNESLTWQRITRLFYRFADVLVVQTKGVTAYYKNYGIPLKVINNPLILPAISRFNKNITKQADKKTIIMVGRLHPQKKMEWGIKAFHQIQSIAKNWQLEILGDGEERGRLEALVKKLNLQDKVIFRGKVNNVFDYLQKASIFLMTSEAEGYPNVLIEAMAMGLPCISTNCNFGPAEIIKSEVNGVLVPMGDIAAIASALKVYILDKKKCQQHGKEAAKIRQQLALSRIAEQWETLFPLDFSQKNTNMLRPRPAYQA